MVLLCRICIQQKSIEEIGCDVKRWTSIISDKAFLPWLLKIPSEKEQLRARQISTKEIIQLEDKWMEDPNATLDDLQQQQHGEDDAPNEVLPCYDDGYLYQNIFGPLVKLEADEDKKMTESQRLTDISIRWELGVRRRHVANFYTQANRFSLSLASNSTYTVGDSSAQLQTLTTGDCCAGDLWGSRTEKLPRDKSGDIRTVVEETEGFSAS